MFILRPFHLCPCAFSSAAGSLCTVQTELITHMLHDCAEHHPWTASCWCTMGMHTWICEFPQSRSWPAPLCFVFTIILPGLLVPRSPPCTCLSVIDMLRSAFSIPADPPLMCCSELVMAMLDALLFAGVNFAPRLDTRLCSARRCMSGGRLNQCMSGGRLKKKELFFETVPRAQIGNRCVCARMATCCPSASPQPVLFVCPCVVCTHLCTNHQNPNP
jgi:hypothetical protein